MRKSSNRTPQRTSPLISPAMRDSLVFGPHAHLEMFFSGGAEVEQMKTVASFLNLGSVMSADARDGRRQDLFHRGLDIVVKYVRESVEESVPAPTPEDRKELEQCFTLLDRWLAVQTIHSLNRASVFINRAIQTRTTADVETVFGDIDQ